MDYIIEIFMEDVAQGLFGACTLTYTDVYNFMKCATLKEKKKVKRYYEKYSNPDTEEDDIKPTELELFIKQTIISHN